MPLTEFQRAICRILAAKRVEMGDAYVAGGAALNESLQAPRVSRDVDLFHDTREAVLVTSSADRALLAEAGHEIRVLRDFPSFVEAEIHRGSESVILQWVQDSAFRFFPLIHHPDFGLVLHPLDLAINKVLALIGRIEIRDWVDVISCHTRLQPFGCLVWAAVGKDPGLNPQFILDQAARSTHYSKDEYALLDFAGAPPDPAALKSSWHTMLREGAEIVELLPESHLGCCVLGADGSPFNGSPGELAALLQRDEIHFHPGSIRGAWPIIKL